MRLAVGGLAAAGVSTSLGLVRCCQGPPALPPLLSAGSATAKKWLNKALFICADCIHCTSQLLSCGTTQICPALQQRASRRALYYSLQRVAGGRLMSNSVTALFNTADPTTSTHPASPKLSLSLHLQHSAAIGF